MKQFNACLLLTGVFCLATVCARGAQTNWVMTANFQLTSYAQASHYVSGTRLVEKVAQSRLVTKSFLALLNNTTNVDGEGVLSTNLIPTSSTLVLKRQMPGDSVLSLAARYRHGSAAIDIPLEPFVVITISRGVRSGTENLVTGVSAFSARQFVSLTYTNQQGTGFVISGVAQAAERSTRDKIAGDVGVLPATITVTLSGDGMIANQPAILQGKLTLGSAKVEIR